MSVVPSSGRLPSRRVLMQRARLPTRTTGPTRGARPSPRGVGRATTFGSVMLGSVTDACGDPPGNICEWVYDRTDGNSTLAELADWLISRPLQIGLILLAAWLISKLARRAIRRFVERIMNPDRDLAARQL